MASQANQMRQSVVIGHGKLENLLNLFLYGLVAEYLVESGITLQAQTT